MRTKGSAEELERRRKLATERVSEGYDVTEVAAFLGVHPASVHKWWNAYQQHGSEGLAAKPAPGRPRKLTPAREAQVVNWLRKNPTSFGFTTELWTASRIAQLITRKWGIAFNPRYLCAWLTQRNLSPQKPQKRARERDEAAIDFWKTDTWPRLQNGRVA